MREVAVEALTRAEHHDHGVRAFADGDLLETVRSLAKRNHCSIYVPSGAAAGSTVKSAAIGRIDTVTVAPRKPRDGLRGAPFIVEDRSTLTRSSAHRDLQRAGSRRDQGFRRQRDVAASLAWSASGSSGRW